VIAIMNCAERIFERATPTQDRLTNAATWESGARQWPSSEQQTLTCCRVTDETHDVKSFEFRTQDGLPVRFEPGQFMTVSAIVQGQAVERCYTISSPPTRPYLVSITVKRVRPVRHLHVDGFGRADVALSVGGFGRHAADVDDPCERRSRTRPRYRLRA
jgi:hypothetical protein